MRQLRTAAIGQRAQTQFRQRVRPVRDSLRLEQPDTLPPGPSHRYTRPDTASSTVCALGRHVARPDHTAGSCPAGRLRCSCGTSAARHRLSTPPCCSETRRESHRRAAAGVAKATARCRRFERATLSAHFFPGGLRGTRRVYLFCTRSRDCVPARASREVKKLTLPPPCACSRRCPAVEGPRRAPRVERRVRALYLIRCVTA